MTPRMLRENVQLRQEIINIKSQITNIRKVNRLRSALEQLSNEDRE
jgi:hypothetical protein